MYIGKRSPWRWKNAGLETWNEHKRNQESRKYFQRGKYLFYNKITSLEPSPQICGHILRYWELELQHVVFIGTQFSNITLAMQEVIEREKEMFSTISCGSKVPCWGSTCEWRGFLGYYIHKRTSCWSPVQFEEWCESKSRALSLCFLGVLISKFQEICFVIIASGNKYQSWQELTRSHRTVDNMKIYLSLFSCIFTNKITLHMKPLLHISKAGANSLISCCRYALLFEIPTQNPLHQHLLMEPNLT